MPGSPRPTTTAGWPRSRRRRDAIALVVAVATVAALAGCGSDSYSDSDSTTSANTGTQATAKSVTVDATEYAFDPPTLTADAGKVSITLANKGKIPHELVVLKTDEAPGALTVSGGRVSEDAAVGEVSETDGGSAKTKTFDLKAGRYVYVCNIPGHYKDGMRGALTVK